MLNSYRVCRSDLSLAAAKGFGGASSSKPKKHAGYTGAKALRRSANNYDKLRKDHGDAYDEHGRDLYVRSPLNSPTTFWFVGKLVRRDDSISIDQAATAQKRLILDYARHELRPQNFAGKYQAALELWMAPADSEMDTVQGKNELTPVQKACSDERVKLDLVGYNPEIYIGDEKAKGGLRVERNEDGTPRKTFEVNQSL